ncbi:hypothetical protein IW262DRAFT_1455044 [Armillaria fumosa]|nr:hypothetical protein IW262DRAFT_1455044 [Armillaria fumosa]
MTVLFNYIKTAIYFNGPVDGTTYVMQEEGKSWHILSNVTKADMMMVIKQHM